MFTKTKKRLHIYSSKFTFTQLMDYLNVVSESEKRLKAEFGGAFYSSITIELLENGEYHKKTVTEFVGDQNAIDKIKGDKIKRIYLRLGDIFTLFCGDDSFSIEYRSEHYQSTHLISNAQDILNIRTSNRLIEMCKNKMFISVMGVLSTVSFIAFAFGYLPATSFLMIFLCTTYLSFAPILLKSRTKIIMENSKDGFITRNRDSIIVGVIFYLLGVGTTPILSLWQ